LRPDLVQIDAFTDRPFSGNPAAICLLDEAADDGWMQAVANEMNLSETAFLVPHTEPDRWSLRWFTPQVEVDLCGHATLAAAHYLFEFDETMSDRLTFDTRSGPLHACRTSDGWIALDFPADSTVVSEPLPGLLDALGVSGQPVGAAQGEHYHVLELTSADAVRALEPDFAALARVDARAFIVTSSGDGMHDIVSRVFGPRVGINEDPVTGSAHCTLATYWTPRLNRSSLLAFQASARGGVLRVALDGDRVVLEGQAVTVLTAWLADATRLAASAATAAVNR
jgi:PhzF family phenazine biosynthesis protein